MCRKCWVCEYDNVIAVIMDLVLLKTHTLCYCKCYNSTLSQCVFLMYYLNTGFYLGFYSIWFISEALIILLTVFLLFVFVPQTLTFLCSAVSEWLCICVTVFVMYWKCECTSICGCVVFCLPRMAEQGNWTLAATVIQSACGTQMSAAKAET